MTECAMVRMMLPAGTGDPQSGAGGYLHVGGGQTIDETGRRKPTGFQQAPVASPCVRHDEGRLNRRKQPQTRSNVERSAPQQKRYGVKVPGYECSVSSRSTKAVHAQTHLNRKKPGSYEVRLSLRGSDPQAMQQAGMWQRRVRSLGLGWGVDHV